MKKLSYTAIATYLESPKKFYWRYLHNDGEGLKLKDKSGTQDLIWGKTWAAFVDRFYKGVPEVENVLQTSLEWEEATRDWITPIEPKGFARLSDAFRVLMPQYYQSYSPEDGVRTPETSELHVEDAHFRVVLDGLSKNAIIHEVKGTSRSKQRSAQYWKVENSLQIKLYAVMTDAAGVLVEFAFKDLPYQIERGTGLIKLFSPAQKRQWRAELEDLRDKILNTKEFVCTSECCLVTKGLSSMCPYWRLCDEGTSALQLYQPRSKRKLERL